MIQSHLMHLFETKTSKSCKELPHIHNIYVYSSAASPPKRDENKNPFYYAVSYNFFPAKINDVSNEFPLNFFKKINCKIMYS